MKYSMLLGAALALGLTPAGVWADQEPIAPGPGGVPSETDRAAEGAIVEEGATHQQRAVPQDLVRASQLINRAVHNARQEQVGSIADVVIESKTGKIRYIALSTGGFLGVGDKMFAIPWNAFAMKTQDAERVVMLNVDNQTLENAEGFDQENWPNMADQQWRQQNDRQFQSATQDARERPSAPQQGGEADRP